MLCEERSFVTLFTNTSFTENKRLNIKQSRMCGVVSLLLLQLQKTLMQHLYCAVVVINYINTQLCQGNCCWWRFRGHSACSFTHQHDNTPVEDSSVVTVATGWAQERLLQDVTAARKQTFNSRLIFFFKLFTFLPGCLSLWTQEFNERFWSLSDPC